MAKITIDNQIIETAPGATILDAARSVGIEIPTLCHLEGCKPNASCMVCVVKVEGRAALQPSCAVEATDGMVIESESDAVRTARRTALELLLSDHAGDCAAPCMNGCPAHMDISRMNRLIAEQRLAEALAVVKADIPLPATLGRICPAPCEPTCRRAQVGGPVSICKLKQYVADVDLASGEPYVPDLAPPLGRHVAVIGAGPAGLSAAYFLLRAGCAVAVYDRAPQPGGALRYEIDAERLPREVLDGEIDVIRRMGAVFHTGRRLGDNLALGALRQRYDAIVVATGGGEVDVLVQAGLSAGQRGLRVDLNTFETNLPGVFAIGAAVRPSRLAIRSVAEGKLAAECIVQFLKGEPIGKPDEIGFNTRLGKLDAQQLAGWFAEASSGERHAVADGADGFTDEQAQAEAARCLHCECGSRTDCRLRQYAAVYDANPNRFGGEIGRPVLLRIEHPHVIYEPGKCIACGLCVQIASGEREALGLTFVDRGFNVHIDAPLSAGLDRALRDTAAACAHACPTGALVLRRESTCAAHV